MTSKLNPLFTPWKTGRCKIKNRIALTSMGGTDLFGWMEKKHFDRDGPKLSVELTAGFGRSFTISEMMENLYTNPVLNVLIEPFMNLDKTTARHRPQIRQGAAGGDGGGEYGEAGSPHQILSDELSLDINTPVFMYRDSVACPDIRDELVSEVVDCRHGCFRPYITEDGTCGCEGVYRL